MSGEMAGDAGVRIEHKRCGDLSDAERNNAWVGSNRSGGVCFVGGGTIDTPHGVNADSYCAGEFNSLIDYPLPNDSRVYNSSAQRRTCQPFDYRSKIIKIRRTG
ncbi:hypothetical protein NLX83_35545 [Allokutzneria sp. A3M-2-11 16]|uniref:hypothetical protein n=1 Tax=Allokutzneria sp. A3M-2-11 16 TaxID=2962043 RepID=UPI0020B7C0AE|nr:hypothetical protein [Allokutzneria sp. A3M-2-11 16]MCP3804599.1 hypothetical protein [Allokutzneria sp. A3M-2-11 16]